MDLIQELITGRFTWFNFILAALILAGLDAGLNALSSLLKQVTMWRRWQREVQRVLNYMVALYEPVAIIVLSVIFVLINPLVHGIILALLFLTGFQHIRDYLSGRIIRLTNLINVGKSLRTKELQGIVSRLGPLGLRLKTSDGMYLLRYTQLLSTGYTLISGEDSGGFYQLRIESLPEKEDLKLDPQHLMDLLATAPYLDLNHQPEIRASGGDDKSMEASILLKEEKHLYDLLSLMKEWGFSCTTVSENSN